MMWFSEIVVGFGSSLRLVADARTEAGLKRMESKCRASRRDIKVYQASSHRVFAM